MKTGPGFERLPLEERGGSAPPLCLLGFTRRKDLQIPQLPADISVHVWEVWWEFTVDQLAIVLRSRPQRPTPGKCCTHALCREELC